MKRVNPIIWAAFCLVVLTWLAPAASLAHGHGHHKVEVKKALLLVTFGTSIPQAQAVFKGVDEAFKKAFPKIEVRWAYTSAKVRSIVGKKQGKVWLSPQEALAKLMADGFTHVAVQSLHVMPGAEFHELSAVVQGFSRMSHHFHCMLGYPLCSTTQDLKRVAKVVTANLPKERGPKDAVVFMGHGTHHPAGVVYAALAYVLAQHDPLVLMGTVEGYPSLNDIVAQLKNKGVKKAYLVPFMTVAGDHAMNDMAGDEPDSWKSVLAKNGIKAVPMMRALTQLPVVVDMYIHHADHSLSHLN